MREILYYAFQTNKYTFKEKKIDHLDFIDIFLHSSF